MQHLSRFMLRSAKTHRLFLVTVRDEIHALVHTKHVWVIDGAGRIAPQHLRPISQTRLMYRLQLPYYE